MGNPLLVLLAWMHCDSRPRTIKQSIFYQEVVSAWQIHADLQLVSNRCSLATCVSGNKDTTSAI